MFGSALDHFVCITAKGIWVVSGTEDKNKGTREAESRRRDSLPQLTEVLISCAPLVVLYLLSNGHKQYAQNAVKPAH